MIKNFLLSFYCSIFELKLSWGGKEDYWIFHSSIVISYRNVSLDDIDEKLHRVVLLLLLRDSMFKAIPWFFEEGEDEKFWKNFQFVIAIANFSIHYDMMTFVCFKPVHNFVQSYQGHPVQSSYTVIIFIRENWIEMNVTIQCSGMSAHRTRVERLKVPRYGTR